jgi:manganese/iron transport system substrate-binding protein
MIRFSRRFSFGAALAITTGIVACTQTAPTQQNEQTSNPSPTTDLPQVVATSTVLCDLTRQIAQETVAVTCLMPPDQDPHVYTPTPSDRKAIEDADLILYGGYNYEPSLIKIIEATTTNAPKVAVYEEAVAKPLMGEHHHAEEAAGADDHDHAEETASADDPDHAEETAGELVPDPHVWHNAQNGVQLTEVIEENLAKLAPDQATLYQQNSAALSQQLSEIDGWIKTQVATIPEANRKLVTTHEALGYYADAYGFELEGAIEGISTEEKPSAARLTELVDQLKAAEVPAIFVETTTAPKQLETVAREANIKIAEQPLFIEGPGGEGTPAPTYQAMLIENTCTIVDELGGKCDRATAPVQEP